MIPARSSPRTATQRRQSGLTLVELMVVTVIIAVLASVATVAYSGYVRRSRAGEARTMLAMISNREATYRGDFNRYISAGRSPAPTSVGVGSSWPSAAPSAGATDWFSGMPAEWGQLGVRPTSNVWFRYVVLAGTPSTTPPGESGYSSSPNQDIWFVAEAYGDLDRNGTNSTFHLFSQGGSISVTGSDIE